MDRALVDASLLAHARGIEFFEQCASISEIAESSASQRANGVGIVWLHLLLESPMYARSLLILLAMTATVACSEPAADDDDSTAGTCELPVDCTATLTDFSACGGDVVGTWALESECTLWGGPGTDPGCPAASTELASAGASGTVVFDGTDVTFTDYRIQAVGHGRHSMACLGTSFTCDALLEQTLTAWEEACCTMVDDDICECWSWTDQESNDFSSNYSTGSDNILNIGSTATEYCVTGDTLTIRFDGGTDGESVMVLQRS